MPSRKNRFYTENPYYTLFIRPALTADGDDEPEGNENSDDEGCYIDENGQVICRAKKSPPSPQPRQPWPDDGEDPDSQPFQNPNKSRKTSSSVL